MSTSTASVHSLHTPEAETNRRPVAVSVTTEENDAGRYYGIRRGGGANYTLIATDATEADRTRHVLQWVEKLKVVNPELAKAIEEGRDTDYLRHPSTIEKIFNPG